MKVLFSTEAIQIVFYTKNKTNDKNRDTVD